MIKFANNNKPKLVVIAGPTASGKSHLAIKLADEINGEIISADSMQVYKYMDIGTAKVSLEERKIVKHHLIDIIEPDEDYDVYKFQKDALNSINEIYSRGKIPIICGGTGFYIQSITKNIDFNSFDNSLEIKKLEELLITNGPEYIYEMLLRIDPEYAACVHPNNTRRVINAISYYNITGQKLSDHNNEQFQKESDYDLDYLVINLDRDELYSRINSRVDKMISEGLVDEVISLRDKGYSPTLKSMQSLGYKEINEYLDGLITLDVAIENIKTNTRHYAKRQITWFKREKSAHYIDRGGGARWYNNFIIIGKYANH